MKVIVKDRAEGKTTDLVKWLCEGEMRDQGYPNWSRVIVSCTKTTAEVTRRMVTTYLVNNYSGSDICAMSRVPHISNQCTVVHKHTTAQIRKAVWTVAELKFNLNGSREFEYAFDDVDMFLAHHFSRLPAVATLSGELYE